MYLYFTRALKCSRYLLYFYIFKYTSLESCVYNRATEVTVSEKQSFHMFSSRWRRRKYRFIKLTSHRFEADFNSCNIRTSNGGVALQCSETHNCSLPDARARARAFESLSGSRILYSAERLSPKGFAQFRAATNEYLSFGTLDCVEWYKYLPGFQIR